MTTDTITVTMTREQAVAINRHLREAIFAHTREADLHHYEAKARAEKSGLPCFMQAAMSRVCEAHAAEATKFAKAFGKAADGRRKRLSLLPDAAVAARRTA